MGALAYDTELQDAALAGEGDVETQDLIDAVRQGRYVDTLYSPLTAVYRECWEAVAVPADSPTMAEAAREILAAHQAGGAARGGAGSD